jgi:ferredoxin
MRVWIDQDGCTGAGLCVDHCPDLFVVLEDGIGYVHDHHVVIDRPGQRLAVPLRHEHDVIDAVARCPGECIYVEPEPDPGSPPSDESDIVDADVV